MIYKQIISNSSNRMTKAKIIWLVCLFTVFCFCRETTAVPVFFESWDDSSFVSGLSISTFDGASYSASGGILSISGTQPNSRAIVFVPDTTMRLKMSSIDHVSPIGSQIAMDLYMDLSGGGIELVTSELFESGSSKRKTIINPNDMSKVAEIIYDDDQYVTEIFDEPNKNTERVWTSIKNPDDSTHRLLVHSYPKPTKAKMNGIDIGKVEIALGEGTLKFGTWYGDTEPVPEPATMFLLGSGLMSLAGIRRKFKK
jgi:hypothetical protein